MCLVLTSLNVYVKRMSDCIIVSNSSGRRICVAENLGRQESFLLLTSLVQHFKILPPNGQSSIQVKDVCGLTINPSCFEVRLIPRGKELASGARGADEVEENNY